MFAKAIHPTSLSNDCGEVADSQCGFCCNCGHIDMIFCAHQLVQKTVEHDTKEFLLFVHLTKAYDSVPREGTR